nr:unnamed protein product [Digitaria exilis]
MAGFGPVPARPMEVLDLGVRHEQPPPLPAPSSSSSVVAVVAVAANSLLLFPDRHKPSLQPRSSLLLFRGCRKPSLLLCRRMPATGHELVVLAQEARAHQASMMCLDDCCGAIMPHRVVPHHARGASWSCRRVGLYGPSVTHHLVRRPRRPTTIFFLLLALLVLLLKLGPPWALICPLIGGANPIWLVGPCRQLYKERDGGHGSTHEVELSTLPTDIQTLDRSRGLALRRREAPPRCPPPSLAKANLLRKATASTPNVVARAQIFLNESAMVSTEPSNSSTRDVPPARIAQPATSLACNCKAATHLAGDGEHLNHLPAATPPPFLLRLLSFLLFLKPGLLAPFRNHLLSYSRCRRLRSAQLSAPCRSSEPLPDPLLFSQDMVTHSCSSFPFSSDPHLIGSIKNKTELYVIVGHPTRRRQGCSQSLMPNQHQITACFLDERRGMDRRRLPLPASSISARTMAVWRAASNRASVFRCTAEVGKGRRAAGSVDGGMGCCGAARLPRLGWIPSLAQRILASLVCRDRLRSLLVDRLAGRPSAVMRLALARARPLPPREPACAPSPLLPDSHRATAGDGGEKEEEPRIGFIFFYPCLPEKRQDDSRGHVRGRENRISGCPCIIGD